MTDVSHWLEALGLGQYASVFAENDVDLDVIAHLTDQELKDLGDSLGHRKKLLNAAAAFVAADLKAAPAEVLASATPTPLWPS